MPDFHCPDCKDTGVYQGLNTVEPCRACCPGILVPEHLAKQIEENVYLETNITISIPKCEAPYPIADVCQQFAIPPCELKADTTEFERGLERAKKSVEAFEILRSGGQSISHELQEQATEPLEIRFPIHSMSQVNIDIEPEIVGSHRDGKDVIVTVGISHVCLTLSDVKQTENGYPEYKRIIQGRTRFTAIIGDGENVHRQDNVTMTAYQPGENGQGGTFTLEYDITDA